MHRETVTGKQASARALHDHEAQGRLVAINYSTIPESLIDFELFECAESSVTNQ
ncbi:sigma 54-interacting transcriptional regulator [Pseudomonas syringae]|uniref:sigma 54-interacting transcriptional regulator n=1 Tax=Pseudomonas syringae TaxID=317 RepID=UPI0039904CA7